MLTEVKLQVSASTQTFFWVAPAPITGTPTLTIKHPTLGDTSPTLNVLAAAATITAMGSDRLSLTTASTLSTTLGGVQGDRFGAAYLVTPRDGAFEVVVRRAYGHTIQLGEPLPAPISVTASTAGVLSWATYSASVPTSYTAAVVRDLAWQVEYRERYGSAVTGIRGSQEGLLHIVRQPFGTGLTSNRLAQLYPGLGARQPRRQGTWDAQIQFALLEIQTRLREDFVQRGITEDDVNGERFLLCHAALAAAYVYDEVEPVKAEALRTRALGPPGAKDGRRTAGLLMDALRAVWSDLDGDGVVDDGEIASLEGARQSDQGSFFTSSSYDSDVRRFTRGESH